MSIWGRIDEWLSIGGKRRRFRARQRGGIRRLMTSDTEMARTTHPSRRRRRRTRRYNVSRRR